MLATCRCLEFFLSGIACVCGAARYENKLAMSPLFYAEFCFLTPIFKRKRAGNRNGEAAFGALAADRLRKGRVARGVIVHQDEGVGRIRDHRLIGFSRLGEGLIDRPLTNRADLNEVLLALRRKTRSDSRSRKRISEQRSVIARGLSIVSDWRSSRSATAPIRRELTTARL